MNSLEWILLYAWERLRRERAHDQLVGLWCKMAKVKPTALTIYIPKERWRGLMRDMKLLAKSGPNTVHRE